MKSMRHYATIIGKIFGIIWKAFCLMEILNKNFKADLLRMQGIIYINILGITIKTISHFHSSVRAHFRLHACRAK